MGRGREADKRALEQGLAGCVSSCMALARQGSWNWAEGSQHRVCSWPLQKHMHASRAPTAVRSSLLTSRPVPRSAAVLIRPGST